MIPFALAVFALVDPPRVQLTMDPSEALAAIAILRKEQSHQSVADADWSALFATVPYQWLKAREASMHREFSDDDFRTFLASPEMIARLPALETTLQAWMRADMPALGGQALSYLPSDATIHALVFPEIKPKVNSFVWRHGDDGPAIFLYLDEHVSQGQFANTVTHECHHIGLQSVAADQEKLVAGKPKTVKTTIDWMGGLGEGEAMLAAAGGPDTHPHAEDDSAARARWDNDMDHFNGDLLALQEFFFDILNGKLVGDEAIRKRADPFWGYQGAWYTVGYRMATIVEKRFGRPALIRGIVDPRVLLRLYNQAAAEQNAAGRDYLSTWSPQLLAILGR
jgi:putative zinc-dependent peptidase DUF5700